MIICKTPEEIAHMKRAGIIVAGTLKYLASIVKPGYTTEKLDAQAEEYTTDLEATVTRVKQNETEVTASWFRSCG